MQIPLEGPVLIVAGPGTGKTWTLTHHIANILKDTDTPAETIMCLTFTEAAAGEMRTRLRELIDGEADKVHISTYHSLGQDLLRTYADYLDDSPFDNAVDDLTSDQLIRTLIKELGTRSPLRYADSYLGDIKKLISECKRSLMTPAELRKQIGQNLTDIETLSAAIHETIPTFKTLTKATVSSFEELSHLLAGKKLGEYGLLFVSQLREALDLVRESHKTTPLTLWKKTWFEKNNTGDFIAAGFKQHRKLLAFADLYESYNAALKSKKLFDFDDMILRSIELLRTHDDLRLTLQERYQYLLLDEFQDTNAAQFTLVKLMSDSPIHEGRPNIIAVGDDDQAIYAFQGADHTNMRSFLETYRQPTIITLEENRRSGETIIKTFNAVSKTISERLEHVLDGPKMIRPFDVSKQSSIDQAELTSDAEEKAWIAQSILHLHESGVPLKDIAILAPKHKYLESIVPYLHALHIPVSYERRENILDDEVISLLRLFAATLVALRTDPYNAAQLMIELLSHEMWQLQPVKLWQWSLQARREDTHFVEVLAGQPETSAIIEWLVSLSMRTSQMTIEATLDECIGNDSSISPLYRHFFSEITKPRFSQLLNNLQLLRYKIRSYLHENTQPTLVDFVTYLDAYRENGLGILNANPHQEATDAVQVMTVYQSKGREFEHVYVPFLVDEVWGSKSRDKTSALSLPANLAYLAYQGKSDDERKRILYVALSRAKSHLVLSRHQKTIEGRTMTPLTLLDLEPNLIEKSVDFALEDVIEPHWHDRHSAEFVSSDGQSLIRQKLATYRLSASHFKDFTDLIYCGPASFLLYDLLAFPKASIPEALYGDAVHKTLEWYHRQSVEDSEPNQSRTETYFGELLSSLPMSPADRQRYLTLGNEELWPFIESTRDLVSPQHISEVNFRADGIVWEGVRLTGSIDRIHIDQKTKSITIYDFKTGHPFESWKAGEPKLHTYKKQLVFYKLLIEHSLRYRSYTVEHAELIFVERNEDGNFVRLPLRFNEDEVAECNRLVKAVWATIQSGIMPDVSQFPQSLSGTIQFEKQLLDI